MAVFPSVLNNVFPTQQEQKVTGLLGGNFNDRLQGLLGNPLFNAGLAMLSNQGPHLSDALAAGGRGLQQGLQYQQLAKDNELKRQLLQSQIEANKAKSLGTGSTPSVIAQAKFAFPNDPVSQQEYVQHYNDPAYAKVWTQAQKLPPEDRQKFWSNMRAMQFQNVAGVPVYMQPGEAVPQQQPLTTLSQEAAGQAAVASAKAAGATAGKTQAENRASLPNDVADVDKMIQNINGLLNDPGFDMVYGASGVFDPRAYWPGGEAASAKARLGQLNAMTFGITIQKMRGLGSLSDAEGKKISAAYTRATNPNLGDADARDAWKEVIDGLNKARNRLYEKAGVTPPGESQSGPINGEPSQSDLEYTAQKYGITIDEVKRRLGIQ